MRLIIIQALVIFFFIMQVLADDASIDMSISRLNQGDSSMMDSRLYPDKSESANQFARKAKQVKDDQIRLKILHFAANLEKYGMLKSKQKNRSQNIKLLDELANVLVIDDSHIVLQGVAKDMRDLFSPSMLANQKERLREAAYRTPLREVVLLYGSLKNVSKKEIEDLINKMEEERRADPITVDSLRGRYGDSNASTRIIERLLLMDEVGMSSADNIIDAVTYLSNAQAINALAQGMRSEKMIMGNRGRP